jgi:hypothetical protein
MIRAYSCELPGSCCAVHHRDFLALVGRADALSPTHNVEPVRNDRSSVLAACSRQLARVPPVPRIVRCAKESISVSQRQLVSREAAAQHHRAVLESASRRILPGTGAMPGEEFMR